MNILVKAFDWCCDNGDRLLILAIFGITFFLSLTYKQGKETVHRNRVLVTELIERLGMDTTPEDVSMTAVAQRLRELEIDVRRK